MSHAKTIKVISEGSNAEILTCEQVIDSYENYCKSHIFKFSRKHMDAIVSYISADTLIEEEVCCNVMNQLFQVLTEAARNKNPFRRLKNFLKKTK